MALDNIIAICQDFPGGSVSKESACNAVGPGSIPGLWRSPGEGNGNPFVLSREFHGQRSLASYSPWHLKESDRTERLIRTGFFVK